MNFSTECGQVRRKGGFRRLKWSGISRIAFFRETGEEVYVDRVLNNKRDFASLLGCL